MKLDIQHSTLHDQVLSKDHEFLSFDTDAQNAVQYFQTIRTGSVPYDHGIFLVVLWLINCTEKFNIDARGTRVFPIHYRGSSPKASLQQCIINLLLTELVLEEYRAAGAPCRARSLLYMSRH